MASLAFRNLDSGAWMRAPATAGQTVDAANPGNGIIDNA
jgi:hypothetical protein